MLELAALEDHIVQNPFMAVGHVKPGAFRILTLRAILFGLNFTTRHIFNRGVLSGVKSIHFARWVFIDDKRRMFFASNYDGSMESYMDDFIDKVAWGLNLVFSNGVGYPKTNWLDLRRRQARARLQGLPARAPGADARLVLRLRRPDGAEHRAERADPRRACATATSRSGCSRCDARARRRPGALRPRLRRPEVGGVPAAEGRGRGRRAALARRGERDDGRGSPAGARAQRRVHELRARAAGAAGGRGGDVLERVRRRDDDAAPDARPRRRRRERAGAVGLGRPGRARRRGAAPLREGRRGHRGARADAAGVLARQAARHRRSRRLRAVRLPRRDLAAVRRGARQERPAPRRPSAPASSCTATRTSTARRSTSPCSGTAATSSSAS